MYNMTQTEALHMELGDLNWLAVELSKLRLWAGLLILLCRKMSTFCAKKTLMMHLV